MTKLIIQLKILTLKFNKKNIFYLSVDKLSCFFVGLKISSAKIMYVVKNTEAVEVECFYDSKKKI